MFRKILIFLSAVFAVISLNAATANIPDLEKNKELIYKLYQTDYMTFIGNKDAKVVIFDFFDYNCSDCKNIAPTLEKLAKENPNVKVVFIDYPILRPPAMYAAQTCIAALGQDKYFQLHDAYMSHVGRFATEEEVDSIAQKNGVDISKVKTDASIKSYLFKNLELGHKLGLNAVPTLFIGNAAEPHNTAVLVEPKADTLEALVNKYLKQ